MIKNELDIYFKNIEEIEEVFVTKGTNRKSSYPIVMQEEDMVEIQFCGFNVLLFQDGTYLLNDTTGG